MDGYHIQECCHNCAHIKIASDYSSPDYYFCNIDKTIPKYNNVDGNMYDSEDGQKDVFLCASDDQSEKIIMERNKINSEWEGKHEVEPHGICNNHKKAPC